MIMLVSDVHCQFELINQQVLHAERKFASEVTQVIVLGDLGFFEPELNAYFKRNPEGFLRPVAFIEGNHEDYEALADIATEFTRHLLHLPRVSRHKFGGFSMLAIGGAAYMDAAATPLGSEITSEQVDECLAEKPGSIDIVLSHDCPQGIGVTSKQGFEYSQEPGFERGLEIANHLEPQLWFFGHHHNWFDIYLGKTRFVGIAEVWKGYALLLPDGRVVVEKHELPRKLSWWQRLWSL